MPIFEYHCNACKAEFEKLIFANDDKEITCPDCNSAEVSKKMSAASLPGSATEGCSGSHARPVP